MFDTKPDRALRLPLYSGCVGEAAAVEFVGFLDIMERIPSIDEVLMDPDGAEVPEAQDVAVLYALTASAGQAGDERKRREGLPIPQAFARGVRRVLRQGNAWPRQKPWPHQGFHGLRGQQPRRFTLGGNMKIQRLERPEIVESLDDMTRAQFNRLAYFIENFPQQGSISFNDLSAIGHSLISIAKDGRKRED